MAQNMQLAGGKQKSAQRSCNVSVTSRYPLGQTVTAKKVKEYFMDLAESIPENVSIQVNETVGIGEMMASFFFNGISLTLSAMDLKGGVL